jgi:hypothetical protein
LEDEGRGCGVERAGTVAIADIAASLDGGETLVPRSDGDGQNLAKAHDEVADAGRLGGVKARHGKWEADDDLIGLFGFDQFPDGLDKPCFTGDNERGARVGEKAQIVGDGDAGAA